MSVKEPFNAQTRWIEDADNSLLEWFLTTPAFNSADALLYLSYAMLYVYA
jgi:hypothetical protein